MMGPSPKPATMTFTNIDDGVQFQAASSINREDAAGVRVAVVRGERALATTVDCATTNGTAVAGQDYTWDV